MKIDTKGFSSYTGGKARVRTDLLSPLKPGTFASQGGKKLWVDFKYERLPHFRYACSCIGHYAKFFKEEEYDENWLEIDDPSCFGRRALFGSCSMQNQRT